MVRRPKFCSRSSCFVIPVRSPHHLESSVSSSCSFLPTSLLFPFISALFFMFSRRTTFKRPEVLLFLPVYVPSLFPSSFNFDRSFLLAEMKPEPLHPHGSPTFPSEVYECASYSTPFYVLISCTLASLTVAKHFFFSRLCEYLKRA